MIDFTDPIIKKFIESLHRVVERKSQKIASKPYDEYVLENRILKLFCADKMITPDECAEKINDLYNIGMNATDIIGVLRVNRLSRQSKRAALLDWAEETVAAFIRALDLRRWNGYENYMTVRNTDILTSDGERHKIQERLVILMLYTKYPVLDGGSDCKAIEKFGNVYMKHFLYDASDFLRSICHNDEVFQPGMTVEEFLINDPDAQSMLIAPRNSI